MRPLLIGITGGIASGKSTVSQLLKLEGYSVVFADQIGHEILSYPEIVNKIRDNFGQDVIKGNIVDRQQLRDIVFNDEDKRVKLNQLLHPEILKLMDDMVDHSLSEYLFFEIPLLFESHLQACLDFIVLVAVEESIQIQRLKLRNNYQETEAKKIICTQMPLEEKKKMADLIIENNGTEQELQNHVWNIIKYLSRINKRKIKRFSDVISSAQ